MRALLYEIIKPARGRLAGVMLLSVIVSLISVAQPALMQKLIDEGIMADDASSFAFWLACIVGAALAGIGFSSWNRIRYTAVSMQILFAFRERVFAELFRHSRGFFARYPTGDLLGRLQGDTNELQQFATDSLLALFSAFVGLIGILWIIHDYSVVMTLAVLCLLPFEFLLLRPLYGPMERSVRGMRENSASLSQTLLEALRHAPLFQNYSATWFAGRNLSAFHDRHETLTLRNLKLQLVFSQLPALVSLAGRSGILLYGGMAVMHKEMSLGELIAFLTYFGMILGPVQTLLGVLNGYPKAKVSFARITELLPSPASAGDAVPAGEGTLCVRGLSYGLPDAPGLLFSGLDLQVGAGETVVITGRNGAGKSTLVDVLCGLERPCSGEVFVEGHPIRSAQNGRLIAKLEQHPVILHDTLRNNLLLGRDEVPDETLAALLDRVGLSAWLAVLPEGLQTRLGESGATLSGGERQRLALARLALLNPAVAIFDEFTSSLDAQSVEGFFSLIRDLFRDSARLIISHDMKVFDYADRVYMLSEGTLAARSNP